MTQRPRQKLVVQRETLRQRNELELTRAHGGGPVVAFESETTCMPRAGLSELDGLRRRLRFHIGNAAHTGIAASYVAAHGGDVVRASASPVGSMLTTLKRMLGAQREKIDKGC